MKVLLITSLLSSLTFANPLSSRQTARTATLDLAGTWGPANQLAAGVLYGTPDTQNQIPDRFYAEAKLKYFRAGGAQLFSAGQRGWHWNEYGPRFASTRSNCLTARKYGGEFPHDIWGTDTVNSSTRWPGDNGDWTSYDRFLDRLIADIKSNNMIPGLKIDIWNEADFPIFWTRSSAQFNQLWVRTYQRFRADSTLRSVPLIGPSFAGQPHPNNVWWTDFMRSIASSNTAPDQYTWHTLGSSTDPTNDIQNNIPTMQSFYRTYNAPARPYSINEYINAGDERMNAANAWNIARLERYNATGLRPNWLSGGELHDFLAELVYRPNAQSAYQPNGAWQMYKYYAQSMPGTRLATTGSSDRVLDIFATRAADGKVRILTGVRAQTGDWEIEVRNLQAIGLPAAGTLAIQTWGFDDIGLRGVSVFPID